MLVLFMNLQSSISRCWHEIPFVVILPSLSPDALPQQTPRSTRQSRWLFRGHTHFFCVRGSSRRRAWERKKWRAKPCSCQVQPGQVRSDIWEKWCVITSCENTNVSGFAALKQLNRMLAFDSQEIDAVSKETHNQLQRHSGRCDNPGTQLSQPEFNHDHESTRT